MKHLFQFEQKHKKELEALLSNDPYEENSFARIGYVLKESKTLGLKGGFLILYFKTTDETAGKKLVEKLKTIPSCQELKEKERETALREIEKEEENAASGFGSIFG